MAIREDLQEVVRSMAAMGFVGPALGVAALLRKRASRAATGRPAAPARKRGRPGFSSLPPIVRAGVIALAFGCTQSVAAPIVFFGEDLGAGSAAAMPNSFAARDAFIASLGSYGTEQFEGFAGGSVFPDAGALTFSGSTVTASISGGLVRSAPFNARFPVSGTNYLDTSFNQRITFSTQVSAFGLFVTDANELDNDPAAVTVDGQVLTQAQIEARPFDAVDGIFRIITERSPGVFELLFDGGTFPALDSSGMFVGIINSANPFSNVILINGASGLDLAFQDGFAYDDIIVGTIPEPATLALLCLGLAGLAVKNRKAS
jgi:hypothetical protein